MQRLNNIEHRDVVMRAQVCMSQLMTIIDSRIPVWDAVETKKMRSAADVLILMEEMLFQELELPPFLDKEKFGWLIETPMGARPDKEKEE